LAKARLALLSVVLSVGALATGAPASGETLRIGGSGSVTELLRQIAPVFEAETDVALEVVPSIGTFGANAALADGVLGIAMIALDLTAAQAARGLRVVATFRTPYGLATSLDGRQNLKSAEIAQLYRSAKPEWPDGTPILLILRPANQSDTFVLGAMFPGMPEALQSLRKRNDISIAFSDRASADMGEKTKGSLVGATLTQIETEKRNLRLVSIDDVAATLENFESGSYRYGKTLYLVVPAAPSREAAAFAAFLARPAGAALLRKAGIVPGAP
jgi:phosphate transport system substrate-binding protein